MAPGSGEEERLDDKYVTSVTSVPKEKRPTLLSGRRRMGGRRRSVNDVLLPFGTWDGGALIVVHISRALE